MVHPLEGTSQPRAGCSISEPQFLFVNGAGHTRSVTRGHGARSDQCARQSLSSRKRTAAARETVPTTLSFPRGHGISQESWWFPGQTSPSPSPLLKCRCSGSGGHSHGSFVPTQAGLLPNALTPGSCQPDCGGGAPLLCLPHPSFPDTSCPLQALGACSADTDRIWASLSIYFLLTSALKSLKLKTRAVRPRAWNGMTTESEVRQVQP